MNNRKAIEQIKKPFTFYENNKMSWETTGQLPWEQNISNTDHTNEQPKPSDQDYLQKIKESASNKNFIPDLIGILTENPELKANLIKDIESITELTEAEKLAYENIIKVIYISDTTRASKLTKTINNARIKPDESYFNTSPTNTSTSSSESETGVVSITLGAIVTDKAMDKAMDNFDIINIDWTRDANKVFRTDEKLFNSVFDHFAVEGNQNGDGYTGFMTALKKEYKINDTDITKLDFSKKENNNYGYTSDTRTILLQNKNNETKGVIIFGDGTHQLTRYKQFINSDVVNDTFLNQTNSTLPETIPEGLKNNTGEMILRPMYSEMLNEKGDLKDDMAREYYSALADKLIQKNSTAVIEVLKKMDLNAMKEELQAEITKPDKDKDKDKDKIQELKNILKCITLMVGTLIEKIKEKANNGAADKNPKLKNRMTEFKDVFGMFRDQLISFINMFGGKWLGDKILSGIYELPTQEKIAYDSIMKNYEKPDEEDETVNQKEYSLDKFKTTTSGQSELTKYTGYITQAQYSSGDFFKIIDTNWIYNIMNHKQEGDNYLVAKYFELDDKNNVKVDQKGNPMLKSGVTMDEIVKVARENGQGTILDYANEMGKKIYSPRDVASYFTLALLDGSNGTDVAKYNRKLLSKTLSTSPETIKQRRINEITTEINSTEPSKNISVNFANGNYSVSCFEITKTFAETGITTKDSLKTKIKSSITEIENGKRTNFNQKLGGTKDNLGNTPLQALKDNTNTDKKFDYTDYKNLDSPNDNETKYEGYLTEFQKLFQTENNYNNFNQLKTKIFDDSNSVKDEYKHLFIPATHLYNLLLMEGATAENNILKDFKDKEPTVKLEGDKIILEFTNTDATTTTTKFSIENGFKITKVDDSIE